MPEISLNDSQKRAIDALADKFMKTVNGKLTGSDLETRRAKLANTLDLCLSNLATANHQVGGLMERTLDQNFKSLSGNDLIFNLKRIAFPEGQDSTSLNDELQKRRWNREELIVGQVIVFNTTGYVVTSIEEGVIKGKLLVIESIKRKEYVSANVPQFLVTTVGEVADISSKDYTTLSSFKDMKELQDFLFELDIKRYRVYTETCKYLVSSLRNRI